MGHDKMNSSVNFTAEHFCTK